MKSYYVFAPVSKKYGTGHWKRSEKASTELNTIPIDMNHISNIKEADKIYVDVKKSSFLTAARLRGKCKELVFIDDYSIWSKIFGDRVDIHIPHWREKECNIKYEKKPFKKIKVYLYAGGLDPKKVILKKLKEFSLYGDIFKIEIQLGSEFSIDYIELLHQYCIFNNIDYAFIFSFNINNVDLGEYDLIYMTWGLHYLNYYDKYKIIPIGFDRHTRKLIKYFTTKD